MIKALIKWSAIAFIVMFLAAILLTLLFYAAIGALLYVSIHYCWKYIQRKELFV